MSSTRNHEFAGFEQPDQNWFRLPKSWATVTRSITSIAELKVVEYVLQHTWSQHEQGASRRISINEFRLGIRSNDNARIDQGTGLSKQSIITGLKKAVQRGLLIATVDDRDRARVHKSYRLRMKSDPLVKPNVERSGQSLDSDVQVFDPVQPLDTRGQNFGHRSDNGNGIGSQEKRLPVTVNQLQNNYSSRGSDKFHVDQYESPRVGEKSPLKQLPDNTIPSGQRDHLADVLIQNFRDVDNKAYYILVSRKIREQDIWANMAEIQQDPNVRNPERVFAARMKKIATERLASLATKTKRQEYEKRRREHTIGSL